MAKSLVLILVLFSQTFAEDPLALTNTADHVPNLEDLKYKLATSVSETTSLTNLVTASEQDVPESEQVASTDTVDIPVEDLIASFVASSVSKTTSLKNLLTEQAVIISRLVVSLSEAEAEIKELKKTTEVQIEQIKASEVEMVAELQWQIDSLTTRYNAVKVEIEELKRAGQENVTSLEEQFETRYSATDAKIEGLKTSEAQSTATLQGQLNSLSTRFTKEIADKGTNWPEKNSFCILANGACPPGFTRSSGHMRAISLYAGSATYITQGKFGDSRISCHGGCGQYGHWTGELYLTTCCK